MPEERWSLADPAAPAQQAFLEPVNWLAFVPFPLLFQAAQTSPPPLLPSLGVDFVFITFDDQCPTIASAVLPPITP